MFVKEKERGLFICVSNFRWLAYDCDDKVTAVTERELGGRMNAGALK